MRTALEAVLQAMIIGGWANESDGDVTAPMGAFARVTNEAEDKAGIEDAFHDVMDTYECEYDALIGHWLVEEASNGAVRVTRYDNPIHLTRDFQQLQDDYALWEDTTPLRGDEG